MEGTARAKTAGNSLWSKAFTLLRLYRRGEVALHYAEKRGAPGMAFNRFGRRIAWRLLLKGSLAGAGWLLTPVNSTRYLEFPFALSCLPPNARACLDVSCPRLFSIFVATRRPQLRVRVMNPDRPDFLRTTEAVSKLGIKNIRTECSGVDVLVEETERYDCIWAISVVEHISGDCDDTHAVRLMYGALRRGGRLILTVPVDRSYWEEYRRQKYYDTQQESGDGRFFFQRFYDRTALWKRLVGPTGEKPSIIRWFGETSPGIMTDYEKRWMREGHACTVNGPREIADHWREYATWEDIPGMGVCGLMIEKAERADPG